MFLKSGKKLTIHSRYTPVTSFLSPVQRCNHRSFSASSLPSSQQKPLFSGSLREQIKLDSFKKSVLGQSKLNKTAFNKATLKVNAQEQLKVEDLRNQVRALQLQLSRSKEQILKLSNQHKEDMLLISRQSELLVRLQKELAISSSKSQYGRCECFQSERYIIGIRNLQVKIQRLQQEKKEFKQEIRNLVVKQEQLKHQLKIADQRCTNEVVHNRHLQNMLYDEENKLKQNKQTKQKQQNFGQEQFLQEKKRSRVKNEASKQAHSNLQWCQDFIKRGRIREIEEIQSILKQ